MRDLDAVAKLIGPEASNRGVGIIHEVDMLLNRAEDTLLRLRDKVDFDQFDLVGLDWAGIGDALDHSRLILQHMIPTHPRIAWITIPIVVPLFKDDNLMTVLPGFECPYRSPGIPWIMATAEELDKVVMGMGFKKTMHISTNVCRYFVKTWWANQTNYSDLFFSACGVKRDFTIKHALRHVGIPPMIVHDPYVILEHAGGTCGMLTPKCLGEIMACLKRIGIKAVAVGSKNDPPVDGAIDARGLSLYDTLPLVKNSLGVIAKSSGNSALACYAPDVPVFEVMVAWTAAFANCGLKDASKCFTNTEDTIVGCLEKHFGKA